MTPRIRRAALSDAAAIAAMLRALNAEPGCHPERLTPDIVRANLLADPRSLAWVAERDGAPIALATAHPTFDTATSRWGLFLSDLWVEPAHRRQGIARALLAALRAEPGYDFLWWNADAGDDLALAFHRSLGAGEAPTVDFILERT
ncbi:MAG: GNAT family N-acetyltransferase [Acetobacteraceae bacterium]|nr:GNAT family N-acetyltransferase [Acetobacteraceae bacterium]